MPNLSSISRNPNKNALLIIGDSIGAANTTYIPNVTTNSSWVGFSDFGPEFWMNSFLKSKKFDVLNFRCRSGLSAFELASSTRANWTLGKIIDSTNASVALIGLGTNDITNGRTASQIRDSLFSICSFVSDRLIKITVKSILPRSSASTWTSANRKTAIVANDLIRTMCIQNGWDYVDITTAICDYSSTTEFYANSNKLVDDTHPNNFGAMSIGKVLSDYFSANRHTLNSQNAIHFKDGYTYDTNSNQLIVNPKHESGWSALATFGGATLTTTTTTAPEGVGNASVCSVNSGNTATDGTTIYQAFSSDNLYVAGVSLRMSTKMVIDNGTNGVSPVGIISPKFSAKIAEPVGGATGGVGGFANIATTGKYPVDIALDIHAETPPLRFTGTENNQAHQVIFSMNAVANSVFRAKMYDTVIKIAESPYTSEKPCFWTDSDTPISVF
jgi:hypothetical protein